MGEQTIFGLHSQFKRCHVLRATTLVSLLLLCAVGDQALTNESRQDPSPERLTPLPQTPVSPAANPTTAAKVELGKQLFFDPRLSGNNDMSCATCHLPEKAFGDGLARAKGRAGKRLARNTPTVLNSGFLEKLFWDGRADTLEQQALAPIESSEEMHQELAEVERELAAIPGYVAGFQSVFGAEVTRQGIAQALAAFQRTLISGPAPLDRYLAGDKDALSRSARRGLEIFRFEAGCIRCHHGPLLSDQQFYRIGVSFHDQGLGKLTGKREDNYKFRTPSLRNVALTAPYMHDGSLRTLDDVVMFYFRGVPAVAPDGLPLDVDAMRSQSFSDITDLVAFLESLTGSVPEISPPELP